VAAAVEIATVENGGQEVIGRGPNQKSVLPEGPIPTTRIDNLG
jgi:hypothetical protein